MTEPWRSRWYASKADFGRLLVADQKIRQYVKRRFFYAGIARIEIERTSEQVTIHVHAARPGIIIGKRGAEVEKLHDDLVDITGKRVDVKIVEVKRPELSAQLVAESVAEQLAKRSSFRKTMKRALEAGITQGARGIRVECSGRLGGSEMTRSERYTEGNLPLTTLDAKIDYGFTEAATKYGNIGVKVWVFTGLRDAEVADADA